MKNKAKNEAKKTKNGNRFFYINIVCLFISFHSEYNYSFVL